MSSADVRARGLSVWRRVLSLSWPMMIQHVFRTLMRTTDVIVTGLFSPAAVAAVGLADLYARFPLRIGLGLGSGAIALSSQDTGGEAIQNRDQAVTQAVLLGLVSGIPFVAFGFLFGEQAIALLGAPDNVAQMGGTYLAIVFASAPARHVALVAARALQGTGDTQTPMYVDVTSSILNIAGSVILGLGLFGAPRLAIVGVGIATVAGNCFTAGVLSLAIWSDRTAASFARPRDWVIAKQLLAVSAPRIGEGLITTLVEFPFNALLLTFGTDVNAAYQIGRRMYQQVTSPLGRAYHTATSVVVGQSLGDGDVAGARFQGWATTVLAVGTMGAIGVALFLGADWLVALFTSDPATAGYATEFARAYAVAAPAIGAYLALAGALQGGSDTRTPFVARVSGLFVFLLGFSYLTSVVLAWGVVGIYAAIALQQFWALAVVAWGFARGDWAAKAAAMMDERGSVDSDGTRFIRPDPTAGMDLISVAAVAENGVIGKDDEVPWHLPADKEQYRDRVAGHPTVFGRRTYEMFADPPGSAHIVLSRTERDFEAADTHHASDVAEAVDIAESLGADRAYVLGGSGIYELFQPHLDGMVLTRVPDEYEGDTYYPEWDEGDWDLVETEAYERFTVEIWRRRAERER